MASTKNSENVSRCVRKRKTDLISIFHSKCCLCGFDLFQEALEFHHVKPEEKEFGIMSTNNSSKALEKQIPEVQKCVLLCANCHRGVHANILTIPDNWKDFFDNDIAEHLLLENKLKRKKEPRLCVDCGKEISTTATRCIECEKQRRERENPKPVTREELKKLIRTVPFAQIGQLYSISDNGVRKWCKSFQLLTTKKEIKTYSDEEWEKI